MGTRDKPDDQTEEDVSDPVTAPPDEETLPKTPDITAAGDPLIGVVVADRYKVERKLGSGGMGTVYKATQIEADRKVALKVLHAEQAREERIVKRFMIEMRATARIEHPNTVRLYDFGHTRDDTIFLAMEYLDGVTLSQEMRRLDGPMDCQRVALLGAQIARGLAAAHAEGIIHRDLKPPNIMLCKKYGRNDLIKVLDFGIARFAAAPADQDTAEALTSPGMVVGTVYFMAPEQMEGRPIDHRVDLYSLGCVLFYMATGQAPFDGPSTMAVMYAQVNNAPKVPSSLNAFIPPWLDDAILRLLEKDPARRYQSAAEVVVALEQGAGVFSRLTDAPPLPRRAAPTEELLGETTSVRAAPPMLSGVTVDPRMMAVVAVIGSVVGAMAAVLTLVALGKL